MSTAQQGSIASNAAAAAAAKERIMEHMNNDHSSSLSDYLQYYSRLPASLAATAELVDISLTQLAISTRSSPTGTTTTYISIRPGPMESYSDARGRLVFMHHEALEGLGKSPIIVDFYSPPKTLANWVTLAAGWFGFYSFSSTRNFAEGSWIRHYILFWAPTLADIFQEYHLACFTLMVIMHFVEAIHMEKSRLRKHQTPRFSLVWWQWIMGTFFEGFGSFPRFDQAVEDIKAKKLKEKH